MSNLVKVPTLEVGEHSEIKEAYLPFADALVSNGKVAQKIRDTYNALETDEEKLDMASSAKSARLATAKQRTALDKVRKELKEVALDYTKRVDGNAKKLKEYAQEIEADMKSIEIYVEQLEANKLQLIREDRLDQIAVIGASEFLIFGTDLAQFTPEQWDAQLGNFQTLVDAKALKAEADARAIVEAEKVEAIRKAELLAEMKKEAQAQAKAEAEKAVIEKAKAEEQAKADKARKLAEGGDAGILLEIASQLDKQQHQINSFMMVSDKGEKAQDHASSKVQSLAEQLRGLAKKLK